MTGSTRDIISQLEANGPKSWNTTTLLELIRKQSSPLTEDERIEPLQGLVKINIFAWLDYITSELKSLASLKRAYLDLLSQIVNQVKIDLPQGPIIGALIEIGATNRKCMIVAMRMVRS